MLDRSVIGREFPCCTGRVAALHATGGERLADLDLVVRNQSGEVKLRGRATVALDEGG